MEASVMFDRAQYANVFKPVEQAETLPAWCYTSPDYYRAEVENMFMKVWNFFGHVDQVPDPGDYMTVTFAGVPLIIARGGDKVIRAFANTCRHRGAPVALGEGNCSAFVCPYHSWTYGLDGAAAGLCGDGEDERTSDKKDNGLKELRLEIFGNFIFINFDGQAEPLMDYLGDFPGDHGLLQARQPEADPQGHLRRGLQLEGPHRERHGGVSPPDRSQGDASTSRKWTTLRHRRRRTGPTSARSTTDHTRALLHGGPASTAAAYPRVSRAARPNGTNYVSLNPSTMLGMTLDCVWYLELSTTTPHSITRDFRGSCFPEETVARPDFEEKVKYYYKRWDKSLGEDNDIAAIQQQGLRSPFVRPGRLSHLEPLIPDLAQWWVTRTVPEN